MPSLDTRSRFADPDAAMRLLLEAHRDLDAGASAALNARLVLLLANHVGDMELLKEAIAHAAAAGGVTRSAVEDGSAGGR